MVEEADELVEVSKVDIPWRRALPFEMLVNKDQAQLKQKRGVVVSQVFSRGSFWIFVVAGPVDDSWNYYQQYWWGVSVWNWEVWAAVERLVPVVVALEVEEILA